MWQSTWYPASPPLTAMLRGIWSVRAAADADLTARVLPDGTSCLVIKRDEAGLYSDDHGNVPWHRHCLSGPRTGPLDIRLSAGGRIFIAQLEPAGTSSLWQIPMAELTDRYLPLESLAGALPAVINDLVQSESSDGECVKSIEDWFFSVASNQLPRQKYLDQTGEIVNELIGRAGHLQVQDWARNVDLSRRQLGRILKERVGLSPKVLARITRFHEAVQLARIQPSLPWIRIAMQTGYADQAHMNREFTALGGIRPSELRGVAAANIW